MNVSSLIEEVLHEVLSEMLFENKNNTISQKEMVHAVERLPSILRKSFPNMGKSIDDEDKNIFPFDITTSNDIFKDRISISTPTNFIIFNLNIVGNNEDRENILSDTDIKKVIGFVESYSKNRGWYVYVWRYDKYGSTNPNLEYLKIILSPEKTEKLGKLPKFLYHITDTKNVASILKTGLIPKKMSAGNRNYSDRVYVFSNTKLLGGMIQHNSDVHTGKSSHYNSLTKTNDVSIIKIDTEKLRQGTKFYKDLEFRSDGAYYTYTHIPGDALEVEA